MHNEIFLRPRLLHLLSEEPAFVFNAASDINMIQRLCPIQNTSLDNIFRAHIKQRVVPKLPSCMSAHSEARAHGSTDWVSLGTPPEHIQSLA